MVKEKMVELKIEIPARWLNFMDEYYQITGRDRNEDLISLVKCQIEMPMLEDEDLPAKDRVRLVNKYKLTDIHEITQRERDEAAGIPRPAQPHNPLKTVIDKIWDNNQKFKETCVEYMKNAPVEALIKAMDTLSPEEVAEVKIAFAGAPAAEEVTHG